mgnify:CR=1 FL=1
MIEIKELLNFLKDKALICIDRITLTGAAPCDSFDLYDFICYALKISRRPRPLWGSEKDAEAIYTYAIDILKKMTKECDIEIVNIMETNPVIGDAIIHIKHKDKRYHIHLLKKEV